MIAIVDIAGKQIKVEENGEYYVPLTKAEPEADLEFDKVLLVADQSGTKVGAPYVNDVKVKAKALEHVKDDKILVLHKKRRKGYQKLNGHRQPLTKIQVTKIG
jgi:large subunit ribosomal protein L21